MAKKKKKIEDYRIKYESGLITFKLIAEALRVHPQSVRNHASKYKWTKDEKKLEQIEAEATARIINEATNKKESELKKLIENKAALRNRLLEEIASEAFFDIKNWFDENKQLKHITDIDPESRAIINSIKITKDGTEYRVVNKKDAQEMLAKYIGLYQEDNSQRNPYAGLSDQEIKQRRVKLLNEIGLGF